MEGVNLITTLKTPITKVLQPRNAKSNIVRGMHMLWVEARGKYQVMHPCAILGKLPDNLVEVQFMNKEYPKAKDPETSEIRTQQLLWPTYEEYSHVQVRGSAGWYDAKVLQKLDEQTKDKQAIYRVSALASPTVEQDVPVHVMRNFQWKKTSKCVEIFRQEILAYQKLDYRAKKNAAEKEKRSGFRGKEEEGQNP